MAITVNPCHTDTPISGVSALSLTRGLVNFGADFRARVSTASNEATVSNLTSPREAVETFRWSVSDLTNVYNGTNIDPSVQSTTRRGRSILCSLSTAYHATDSADPTYNVYLPISTHIVIKVPDDSNVTESMVLDAVGRMISGLFDTGSTGTTRLTALLRGSVLPSDI